MCFYVQKDKISLQIPKKNSLPTPTFPRITRRELPKSPIFSHYGHLSDTCICRMIVHLRLNKSDVLCLLHSLLHSKKTSLKWIDSSSERHLQDSSSIWQGSSSKIVNWMRGQRSNKSLILIINITNRNKKPTSIFLTKIKLSFDLWPLIQFTIFEEEPFKIEEKSCKCPLEE